MKIFSIIFLLIFQIYKYEKVVEKCLFESLNPTDRVFKYSQDIQVLKKAVVDFNLLPRSLQIKFRECEVPNDGLYLCEDKFGENMCEQCGMIYVQKCPIGYVRIDCGLCAQKCPVGTVDDALGGLCAKPKVLKQKIYPSYLDCKKQGNKDCIDYGDFTTKSCPENFRPLGDFLCIFECPQGFIDNDIYCIPSYFETNLIFTGANEDKIKITQLYFNYSNDVKTKQQSIINIDIVTVLIIIILILLFFILIEYIKPGNIKIKKGIVTIFKTSIVLSISISNHIKQTTIQDKVINTIAFNILFFFFLQFFLNIILLKYRLKNLTKGIMSKILHTKLPIIIKKLPITAAQFI